MHAVRAPGSPCPACGGALEPWRMVPASDPALAGQMYELLRCSVCGSAVTVSEEPPELYETGAYNPSVPRLYSLARPLLRTFDRQRLAMLRPLAPPPARLLDIGSGRGRFLASASGAGYDVVGIEPSERGVQAATATGAAVQRASIEQAELPDESFAAITLWHVLEHLDDPGSALERARRWLAPGGALLVGVPNLASLQARVGGERWYHLDVPRHRVHFTPAGLSHLLRSAGFTRLLTHHVLLEHNPFGLWQSLLNRVTQHPSYLYNLLKRNAPVRSRDLLVTVAALPLAPIAALTELLAGVTHRGGTIAVLAQREG